MDRPIITLTTDFGTSDSFVGIMRGVILDICPSVNIVDLTHEVPAGDVRAGAYLVSTSYRYFPNNTIHLIVIDPGVGTERRPVAVETPTATFVCPDNGVLSHVLADGSPWQARHLTNPDLWLPYVSSTFHGRDIFAPVAAHFAAGVPFESSGPSIDTLVTSEIREPKVKSGQILGEVIYLDIYGNLITNIKPMHLESMSSGGGTAGGRAPSANPAPVVVTIADREITGLSHTYQGGEELIALIGSSGTLEIAVRNGNAANTLGIGIGASVWTRQ